MVNKMDIIECSLCKRVEKGERFNMVEFGTWDIGYNDWNCLEDWRICKKCKIKIRKYILSLKVRKK